MTENIKKLSTEEVKYDVPVSLEPSNDIVDISKPNNVNEELIATALTFLKNPKVAVRPKQEKINFLIKKGLSSVEISMALKDVETDLSVNQNGSVALMMNDGFVPPLIPERSPSTSLWSTVKYTTNVLIFLSTAAYGCHQLYLWILRTYLNTQKMQDKQNMLEYQKNMQKIMDKIEVSLDEIRSENVNQNKLLEEILISQKKPVNEANGVLISELACIKSLLLNKRAFPSAPVTGVSLPEWQRIKKKPESNSERNQINGVEMDSKTNSEHVMSSTSNGTTNSDSNKSTSLNDSETSTIEEISDSSKKV